MIWKVISFDFDNTIGYADPPIHVTLSKILERAGIIVDPERVREIRQTNSPVHPLLSQRGWGNLSEEEQTRVLVDGNVRILSELGIKKNVDKLTHFIHKEWFSVRKLYPDVREAFENISELDMEIVILSGAFSIELKPALEIQGLLDYVACFFTTDIVSSNFGPLMKENGSSFRYLLERMNVDPEHVIHVGDNKKLDGLIPMSLGFKAVLMDREDNNRGAEGQFNVVRNLPNLMQLLR